MSRQHWLFGASLMLALAMAVAFLARPDLPVASDDTKNERGSKPTDWSPPQMRTLAVDARFAALQQRQPWGAVAATTATNAAAPNWHLKGTLIHGKERQVLLVVDGQSPVYLKVGDKLPDGTPIVAIEPEVICVKINNKRLLLRVFER